jgi:U3 small nucleolar ribonucleoprotein component
MLHIVTLFAHTVFMHGMAMKKGTRVSRASKIEENGPRKGADKKKKGKPVITATANETIANYSVMEIPESNHPSHLRRGPMSVTEIRELADFLLEHAQALNSIASKMDKMAIKSFDRVDGVTKGARGKRLIAEFTANLNRAMTDQRFSD